MYISVAIVDSGVTPTFALQAGTGDPATLPATAGASVSIFDKPGGIAGGGQYVADAFWNPKGNGVYQINVLLYLASASTWNLTIVNNDAAPRQSTFVVAQSAADSQQPWINMEPAIDFQALVSETGPQTLRVYNYGTGPLTNFAPTITGPGASSFTATPAAGASAPPSGSVDIPVTLQAVATPKSLSATLVLGSNDTTAQTTASHNNSVALTAEVGMLELGFLLDGSGSMALDPDGQAKFIGVDNASTRWGKLQTAAQAALTLLQNYGANKGNFAVGVYPDITGFPASPTATYSGPFPVASPSAADLSPTTTITAANVATAIANIGQHFPRPNGAATPIGAGIAHAIGSTSSSPWGYFTTTNFNLNRRWLILMTDGNDNSDPPYPSDFFGNGTAGQGFVPKQIQVTALGYGNTDAPVQPVNTVLLNQILGGAYEPNPAANYDYAQADASPQVTAKFIKSLLMAGLTLDSLVDPSGVLTIARPTVKQNVFVSEYDRKISFFVAWSTYNAERLIVQVRTPLGEVIEAAGADYVVDANPRFRMVTFDADYLANANDPANPRYGVWTLVITLNPKARNEGQSDERELEPYNFQIIADTGLKLKTRFATKAHAAGVPIKLAALVDLQGVHLTGAAVKVVIAFPENSYSDWLAQPVSAKALEEARRRAEGNPDIDALGIKQLALIADGKIFNPVTHEVTLPMPDINGKGLYEAEFTNTGIPGDYSFIIIANGLLPDGSPYRRETAGSIAVVAVPDPAKSPLQIDYLQTTVNSVALTQATLTLRPRDAAGRAVLIDPNANPGLVFRIHGGHFDGQIVDHDNGAYSGVVTYPKCKTAVVQAVLGGAPISPKTLLLAPDSQHFASRVASFDIGHAAAPGANQHTDPNACLGDCTLNANRAFVSLGAFGSIVLGFDGRSIIGLGHDDFTIYVKSDDSPRAYAVDASHSGTGGDWIEIGRSLGVTHTFGLAHEGESFDARAIRIRDLSGVVRAADGSGSPTPGVSVLGLSASALS
jgi:hypothetical protein